ncbi:MAG TPA: phytoene/squalene synthase family protein [Chthoniobacterales bacterium]
MKTSLHHLRGPILRSVSRSFYLSLRLLPAPLREPISLAYLLARATDTIADTPELATELRIQSLRTLASAIQAATPREAVVELASAISLLQENEAERGLIEALPAAIAWLESLPERDRIEVRDLLQKINGGQTLDLERFGDRSRTLSLRSAFDLNEYTYLVAGCVGEFWTRLCFIHEKNFSDRPESELLELGVEYGKGLQLINILRDAGSDLRQGRCYFPQEELYSLGLKPEELLAHPRHAEPILRKWREKAEHGIAAGIDYACSIRPRRLRFATALPALIGARTLALLRKAGPGIFTTKLKVPRPEIRQIIFRSAFRLASPLSLRETFARLSQELPRTPYKK